MLLAAWQDKHELGAFVGFAFSFYGAAVGFGDLARYGEAEARAVFGARGVGPVEAFEDEGQLIFGDAHAGVGDGQLDAVVLFACPDGYGAAVRGVLHGVVEQYRGHLEDASPVEGGGDLLAGWDELDGELAGGVVPGGVGGLFRNLSEVVAADIEGGSLVAAGQHQ